jgi:hypothetical protein
VALWAAGPSMHAVAQCWGMFAKSLDPHIKSRAGTGPRRAITASSQLLYNPTGVFSAYRPS